MNHYKKSERKVPFNIINFNLKVFSVILYNSKIKNSLYTFKKYK